MDRQQHPLTANIGESDKVLVRMPDQCLRWRRPRWRLGIWYVRDSYGWRELLKAVGSSSFEAGTM